MIVRRVALFVSFAFVPVIYGQTSGTPEIPSGVKYKTATDAVNNSAKAQLALALNAGGKAPEDFFDNVVTCGPMLWRALETSADKTLLESKKIVVVVKSVQTEGRGMITAAQRQAFWQALLEKYPAIRKASIRKATAEEINYYWATIPFDIEEPLLVLDSGSERWIANFRTVKDKPVLFWMDLIGDLRVLTEHPKIVDLEFLTVMAEGGDAASMLQLGKGYWTGNGVTADVEKARQWFDRAAGKGSVEAQLFLGNAYFAGVKVPKDRTTAARYLLAAAEQGNAFGQFMVGLMYRHGEGLEKSDEKAARFLQSAAAQDHAPAEYDLGVMYAEGAGVPKDQARACALYDQAARQGHVRAMNNLGQCYEKGNGVQKDTAKALDLYTRAAEAGHTKSLGNLVLMYSAMGNWEKAYMWLRIAENLGSLESRSYLDRTKERLTQAQIESAEAAVREWMQKHPVKQDRAIR